MLYKITVISETFLLSVKTVKWLFGPYTSSLGELRIFPRFTEEGKRWVKPHSFIQISSMNTGEINRL